VGSLLHPDITEDLRRRAVLWTGAVAVGLAAVALALLAEQAARGFNAILHICRWLPLLVTPAGFALSVWVTRRYFPAAAGSGIPQTIATLEFAPRTARVVVLGIAGAVGKALLTCLGVLCGGSLGREGPTVQIGASIMYSLRRFARFPMHDRERGLILAGGAAGISAAFNTPLAGVVFAIEEMSGSFEHRTSGTVLTAVILAGVTALGLLGNYAYFGSTAASLDWGRGWFVLILCGLVGGLGGGLFSLAMLNLDRLIPRPIKHWRTQHPVRFAAACGLLLALLGVASSGVVYGTGYEQARAMLVGTSNVGPGFAALKIIATLLSQASGVPGGFFAPMLAIGAGIGYDIAQHTQLAAAGAIIILCMVSFLSGVIQAPITSLVIVMELTNDHSMILPIMAASVISSAVSRRIVHEPLYKQMAKRFAAQFTPPAIPSVTSMETTV